MPTTQPLSNTHEKAGVMVNEDYEPTEKEEQVLSVFKEWGYANPLLIREETGFDKGTINTALTNLRAAGWVRRIVRGFYEYVEDPREQYDNGKSQEDAEIETDESPHVDDTPTPEPDETTVRDVEPDENSNLADVDFPSNLDRYECITAAEAARELILEQRGATKKEIVQRVMPEHPLGYNVDKALAKIEAGERYRGAWWRRVIKPALEGFSDVQKPKRGASEWKPK